MLQVDSLISQTGSSYISRGEDPTGKWTIRVSHGPTSNKSKGHFLGWSMSLWGSSIDASVVKQWNIPKLANVFPPIHPDDAEVHPVASASISLAATSTKSYVHPTAMLPDNHTEHVGEAEHPAFPDTPLSSASPSPSAGSGWVSDTTAFVSDQKYLIGVLVVVFAVLAGVGVCLRRRAIRRRHAQYAAVLDGENLPLRSINAHHDPQAAGDDEDADEETGLRSGLGFHSEFLHDEDLNSPGPSPRYRDEPEGEPKGERRLEARSLSDDSGSGESWEHASKLS
jgi:kexin